MSLTTEATALFVKALEKQESALAAALAPFSELNEIIYKLSDNKEFDWLANSEILKRSAYSRTESEHLSRKALFLNPTYAPALSSALAACHDSESLHNLFQYFMRAGQHDQALQIVEQTEDKSLMADELRDQFDFWRRSQGNHSCLYAVGFGSSITFSTLKILDLLGVDLPPYLSAHEYRRGSEGSTDIWEHGRFAVQVEFVGETLEKEGVALPTLYFEAGQPCVNESALVRAFFDESVRSEQLGGWHSAVFPSHVPVVISAKDELAAAGMGATIVTPRICNTLIDDDSNEHSYPHHGFFDGSGSISDQDVMLATSFLGYAQIERLRDPLFQKDKRLALLPAALIPMADLDSKEPSSELAMAMRHHRPEPLVMANMANNWISDSLDTRIYLKGAPSVFLTDKGQKKSLSVHKELLGDPKFARLFSTDAELDWLRTCATSPRHDRIALSVLHYDAALSDEKNLQNLLETLKWYENRLAPGLKYEAYAPVSFYEYMASKRLGLTQNINPRNSDKDSKAGWNLHARPRLQASLGYEYASNLGEYGEKPEDWLNKGVRSKDETVQQKCLGLLDRLPLEEVGALATTPARGEFLIKHFDLSSVMDTLPAKIKSKVVDRRMSLDLGL